MLYTRRPYLKPTFHGSDIYLKIITYEINQIETTIVFDCMSAASELAAVNI